VAQKQQGVAKAGSVMGQRTGRIGVLRSPAIAHMKELINYGQTSNRRFRIKRK
jgi:hypothetical protein